MKTAPQYLLIGNGRVAQHIRHYFSHLQLAYQSWTRQQSTQQLNTLIANSTHILILINDHAIESFIQNFLSSTTIPIIHFSGALVSKLAFGAHPLMSFSTELYADFNVYKAITFVVDEDAPAFESILPGLPNDHVRLKKSLKPRYHAHCVLAGNMSCMLWQKLFKTLEEECDIPAGIAHEYLLQQTRNLIHDAKSALTGPLVRNDRSTIEYNLMALSNDPVQNIYKSFIDYYEQEKIK